MRLLDLGWSFEWEQCFEPYRARGYVPARIVRADRDRYRVAAESGDFTAEVSGRFRHEARVPADYPTIGDWVAIAASEAQGVASSGADGVVMIHGVLPRRGSFSRRAAGERTEEQVLAANVDVVFLVSGLDGDFNPRRIERFAASAFESGAAPIVILNKADVCEDVESRVAEVERVVPGVAILALSAKTGAGLDRLAPYLEPRKTIALLGSSGVGKSTLINALIGEARLAIHEVREDDSRGRHTTTHRELVTRPGGALLIDGPGLRALRLWVGESSVDAAFTEIDELARRCRFQDCRHRSEPGCAVRSALADGSLDAERFESWQKLQREQRAFEVRHDRRLQAEERRKWRMLTKAYRSRPDKRR